MVRSGRRNRPGAFHTQCHGVWRASGRFRLGRMSISVTSAAFPIGVAFAAFPIGPAPAAVASEQKGEWGGWGRGRRDAKTRGPIGSSTAAQIGFVPTALVASDRLRLGRISNGLCPGRISNRLCFGRACSVTRNGSKGQESVSDRLSAGKSSDQVPIAPEVIQHEAWMGVFVVFRNRRLRFVLASAEIQALG